MKKVIILSAAIFFLLSFNVIKAQPGEKFTLSEDAIPIVYKGHIYVQGSADSVKGNFVFDTGASNLYFDSVFFSSHNFEYQNFINAKLPGAGAKPQDVIVVMDTVDFTFGNHFYQTTIVPVLKLKPILGDFSDGILGLNYFSESVLEINYIHEFIKVHESINSLDIVDYTMISMKNIDNRLYVPLTININDSLNIEGYFTLDIGSGGSASLTSLVAQKNNLNNVVKRKVKFYTKYGGVGGESSSYDFTSSSLQISDYVFKQVSMDYSLDTSGAMASTKSMGLLGNQILERFDILIDFKNSNLYLKPNENMNKPFGFSRLGFAFSDRHQTLGAWIVSGLHENRQAEKSGLKIDDQIISVNGISVGQIPFRRQSEFFEKLDEIDLVVKRGEAIKNIKFKLESVL